MAHQDNGIRNKANPPHHPLLPVVLKVEKKGLVQRLANKQVFLTALDLNRVGAEGENLQPDSPLSMGGGGGLRGSSSGPRRS